jgi:hypothetical protein
MAVTPLKTFAIRPPKAPNLPVAPVDYAQSYQDQVLNALRLYFNQIDNYTQSAATPNSGVTTNRPTAYLQIGQTYFDTTLNIPIWWNGKHWVNASGTTV